MARRPACCSMECAGPEVHLALPACMQAGVKRRALEADSPGDDDDDSDDDDDDDSDGDKPGLVEARRQQQMQALATKRATLKPSSQVSPCTCAWL